MPWSEFATPFALGASGTNNVPLTDYGSTLGGDAALMWIGQYGAASVLAVPHDNVNPDGNWISDTAIDAGGGNRAYGRWWYLPALTTSAAHKFGTSLGNSCFCAMVVYVVSGSNGATPFDTSNQKSVLGGTALTTNPVTPSNAINAAFAGLTFTSSNVPTIDSGFSSPVTVNFSAGANDGVAASHKFGSLSGTEEPQWAFSSADAAAGIIVLKGVAGITLIGPFRQQKMRPGFFKPGSRRQF